MTTSTPTGLFIVSYEIGTGLPGAVSFRVYLTVETPKASVVGFGVISQAVNPPLDITTKLEGQFSQIVLPPPPGYILVVATGYPIINWPPNSGIGPVILPNAALTMHLQENWQSGVATFKYVDSQGTWQTVSNVPVKKVTPSLLS